MRMQVIMSLPFAKYRVNSICNKSIRAFKKKIINLKPQSFLLIDDFILCVIYDFYNPVPLHVFHSHPIKNSCSSWKALQNCLDSKQQRRISEIIILAHNYSLFFPTISKISLTITPNLTSIYTVQWLEIKNKASLSEITYNFFILRCITNGQGRQRSY